MKNIFLILLLLLSFSCSNKDLVIPKSACFIKIGFTGRGDVRHEIQYDKNNRPIVIIGDRTTQPPKTTISYKNGKMIRIVKNQYNNNLIIEISYLDNETIQTESYFESKPSVKFYEKYYFKNNLLTKRVSTRSEIPNFSGEKVLTYDNNENLIKKEVVDNGFLAQTIEYKDYDNKVNPYFSNSVDWTILNESGILWIGYNSMIPISKNNPLTIKNTFWINKHENTDSLIFRYNENNLLIGIKTTYSKDDEVSIDYKN